MRRWYSYVWVFSHESLPHCYLQPPGDFEILFDVGLFDFEWTYAIFNPRKTYKTRDSVFAQRRTTTWYEQPDVEFRGESNAK